MKETDKEPLMIKVKQGVFVRHPKSDGLYQYYVTELGGQRFIITRNNTMLTPYYSLYHSWKEMFGGKMREFRSQLFGTSKLEKMINFINENL